MIIYFSGSTRALQKDIGVYRKILFIIHALGHNLHNDWLETAWLRASGKAQKEWDIEAIVQNAAISIESSELFIAEVSDVSTFGVGYEVAYALQKKKPVLLLAREEDVPNSYATGVKNELITFKKYAPEDLNKIIEDFIKEHTLKKKDLRFNFVIDRQIYNHLRWRAYKSSKTKAEVVRDLLLKDMDREV